MKHILMTFAGSQGIQQASSFTTFTGPTITPINLQSSDVFSHLQAGPTVFATSTWSKADPR